MTSKKSDTKYPPHTGGNDLTDMTKKSVEHVNKTNSDTIPTGALKITDNDSDKIDYILGHGSVVKHAVLVTKETTSDIDIHMIDLTITAETTGRNVGRSIVLVVSVRMEDRIGFDSTHSFEIFPSHDKPASDTPEAKKYKLLVTTVPLEGT